MRRKSTRTATKAPPEKVTETTSRRSRRQSKRHRRSSSRSSSADSDDATLKTIAQQQAAEPAEAKVELPAKEDDAEPIWKVAPSEDPNRGEIQKLKLCLTRPAPASPEKTERSSRRRRNKSGSQAEEDIASPEEKISRKTRQRGSPGMSVDEQEEDTEQDKEDKKGKGKSKTKHKSKSEKTPQTQEVEDQTQSEISENVQVTPQSPQAAIDIRVDNESVPTNERETVSTDETETHSIPPNSNTSEICEVTSGSDANIVEQVPEKTENHEHDTPTQPLTERNSYSTEHNDSCDSQENFKGFSVLEQNISESTQNNAENAMQEAVKMVEIESEEVVVEGLDENAEKIGKSPPKENTDSEINQQEIAAAVEVQAAAEVETAAEVEVQTAEEVEMQTAAEVEMQTQTASEVVVQTADIDSREQVQEAPKEEESMIVDEPEPTDVSKNDASAGSESREEESSQLLTRCESKSESTSSEETNQQTNNSQVEPSIIKKQEEEEENQISPVDAIVVEESSSKSVEETHRSNDEDSRSADAITLDTSYNIPSKENSAFNLSQSFSPDIRELEKVNSEVHDLKNEMSGMFPTPQKSTKSEIKRCWGNSMAGLELIKSTLIRVNNETIKELYPQLRFLDESEVKIEIRDIRDRRKSYSFDQREKRVDRKVSLEYNNDDLDQRRLKTQSSVNSSEMEESVEPEVDNSNIIAMNRKISIVDDTASKLKPPPSPAKNPVSEVLFITNLVRPFTLKQLKELLERTGKIRENGFWTDRIKSKCYVYYETNVEAEATRNALHGVHWPIGNGKKLIIDYATPEDLEKARNPTPPPPPPPVIPELKIPEKEPQAIEVPPKRTRAEEHEKVTKERERHRNEAHVREWDIGKENMHKTRSHSIERDVRNDRNDRRRHRRTPSPTEDFITRKQRKKEEDIPQKLMDDLFRKTKATPSIYWLPLSPEEIATKQQQRLLRMAEHKRRMEETTRGRGDYGRGAPSYRRRYE